MDVIFFIKPMYSWFLIFFLLKLSVYPLSLVVDIDRYCKLLLVSVGFSCCYGCYCLLLLLLLVVKYTKIRQGGYRGS